jgi:uncharacterized protein (TIGR02996 family)
MHFTDEQPFLDAIFERYTDDRPRLVYADFLDDAGEPERAELIRVQLALTRLNEDDPRRPQLSDRQAELLNSNRAAWTADLAGLVESVDFRRGVPDSASVNATTFLERGEELFHKLRLRRLRLLEAAPVIEKLFLSPLLANVRELDLCNAELGNPGLTQLARSTFLRNLESLDLGFNGLDDIGVDTLARATGLLNLTSLALNDNDSITGDGLRAIAESPFFAGLTALDVSGNDIGETGIVAVVASPSMARLRTFRVNTNRINDAGIAALANSSLIARMLKSDPKLEVRGNGINAKGAATLAACPAMALCTSLDLTNNYLGDEGTAVLLRSPHLGKLKVLRLGRNQLTDAGIGNARALFDSLFDRVQLLDVSANRLTRYGLGVLHSIRGHRPARLETADNVQSATAGDAPVAVSDLMPDVMQGVAEAARLRNRIANPRHRNENG